jgi:hypothetical protein
VELTMSKVISGIVFVVFGLPLVVLAPGFARSSVWTWTARLRVVKVRRTRLGRWVIFICCELIGIFSIAVGLSVLLLPAPAAQVTEGIAVVTFIVSLLFWIFVVGPARIWGMMNEHPDDPKAPKAPKAQEPS